MGIAFIKGDVSLTRCDAFLFASVHDWPERLQMEPGFSEIVEFNRKLYRGDPVEVQVLSGDKKGEYVTMSVDTWAPGRLVLQPPNRETIETGGVSKKVVHIHAGNPPDYEQLRICLRRLEENYPKLGIKSIAASRIGTGVDLHWRVVEQLLKLVFARPNEPASLSERDRTVMQATDVAPERRSGVVEIGLHVEIYDQDIPGQLHGD